MTPVCLLFLIFSALRAEISWEEYKQKFKLNFENDDNVLRKQIFEENVKRIEAENAMGYSYTLGINHFAHLTKKEINSMFMSPKYYNEFEDQETTFENVSGDAQKKPSEDVIRFTLNVDWRRDGYVTGVKNQGKCGSCYAFATTGNLESVRAMKSTVLEDLSSQQVLDCVWSNDCEGGTDYMSYIHLTAYGAMSWSSYPYKARKETCLYSQSSVVTKPLYFRYVFGRNDYYLTDSVTKRPTTVRLHANIYSFLFYKSGIYENPSCTSDVTDHLALLVGVVLNERENYYILKNSWGVNWGMNGYMHLGKNHENPCGVASTPSYVVMP